MSIINVKLCGFIDKSINLIEMFKNIEKLAKNAEHFFLDYCFFLVWPKIINILMVFLRETKLINIQF